MTFRVGQKVVCISGPISNDGGYGDEKQPEIGRVYTIRCMETWDGILCVSLVEIINPIHSYLQAVGELVFVASRFRPVVSRKTDISIFKRMLTPSQKELAQ